jgi:hypothetical protein
MERYSYSEEIYRSNVVFGEFDSDSIRSMFTQIFEFYNPKVKDQVFDSFCEDFYNLVKEMHTTNEQVWRMLITDMLFHYDEKGYLETGTTDNGIKRKQFAIMAKVIIGKLRKKD